MVRFRNWAREINWLAVIAVVLLAFTFAVAVIGFVLTGQWFLLLLGSASCAYTLTHLAKE